MTGSTLLPRDPWVSVIRRPFINSGIHGQGRGFGGNPVGLIRALLIPLHPWEAEREPATSKNDPEGCIGLIRAMSPRGVYPEQFSYFFKNNSQKSKKSKNTLKVTKFESMRFKRRRKTRYSRSSRSSHYKQSRGGIRL